jgi:hypothetical protein
LESFPCLIHASFRKGRPSPDYVVLKEAVIKPNYDFGNKRKSMRPFDMMPRHANQIDNLGSILYTGDFIAQVPNARARRGQRAGIRPWPTTLRDLPSTERILSLHATFSVSRRATAVALGLAGWAAARASSKDIPELRRNLALPVDRQLPSGYLKNSDDQTVLALTVITKAMATLNRPMATFADWGVVAAPNLFGRAGIFQTLVSFRSEGVWGITPHMIPHHSLHAVSGTISQVLGLHGPNFGIGGGPDAVAEALLVAATMVSENTLPGLWVVLSGHETEYVPEVANHQAHHAATCLAAALALVPPVGATFASCLVVSACSGERECLPEFNLSGFLDALTVPAPTGHWWLPGGCRMRLQDSGP